MSISKELFDKMLRAAILKDRINYTAGLISEVQAALPYEVGAVEKLSKERRLEFYREKNSLGVESLTYEALLKEEIQSAQSRMLLMSGEDYDWDAVWEQRRYEISKEMMSAVYLSNREDRRTAWNDSLPPEEIAKFAVRFADALIEELKRTNNEKH